MKKLLFFTEHYIPGYRAGGPVRSVYNLSVALSKYFDIYIVSLNYDRGGESYNGIPSNTWIKHKDGFNVYYVSDDQRSISHIHKLIKAGGYDLCYTNSFFSPIFSIKLYVLRLLFPGLPPLLVAPRGELHDAALGIKSLKKKLFLIFFNLIERLLRFNVVWHATNEQEMLDIRKFSVNNGLVYLSRNLPSQYQIQYKEVTKLRGEVRLVLLSRVARIKNIPFILELLKDFTEYKIHFDIYGVIDDDSHWEVCLPLIKYFDGMKNIVVNYMGGIDNEKVQSVMQSYHFFVLPTLGENFGHVIMEAILAGKPVLISDKTPWKNLEEIGIGYDIPLEDLSSWKRVLTSCIQMDQNQYDIMSKTSWQHAYNMLRSNENLRDAKEMFLNATSQST